MVQQNKIYLGDCLEIMKDIKNNSIDMILCDLPFGQTKNKWDNIIPLDKLWEQYERIITERGVIVLNAIEPFATKLINSNEKMFKYKIIWVKTLSSNQLNCNYAPLRQFEEILVFSKSAACYVKNKEKSMIYNPQFTDGKPYKINRKARDKGNYDKQKENEKINHGYRYPTDVIYFKNPRIKGGHPTQKPVELLEYLIKTYTNEGDLVLDNCMGSGSTVIACKNTNRNYIGIEKDERYYKIAFNRINGFIYE